MRTYHRAQVGVELLITLGFVIAVVIPLVLIVYIQTDQYAQQLYVAQATESMQKLKTAINVVGTMGEGAQMEYILYIPPRVTGMIVATSESEARKQIGCKVMTPAGESTIVRPTLFKVYLENSENLLTRISREGTHRITIRAQPNGVVVISQAV